MDAIAYPSLGSFAGLLALSFTAHLCCSSSVRADTPNAFEPNKLSAEAIAAFFEACLPDGKEGPLGNPPRLEGRACGCQADWVAGHPEVLLSVAAGLQHTSDVLVLASKLMSENPEFVSAAQRCVDFAIRTKKNRVIAKTPFTPAGDLPAEHMTKKLWSCFAKKRTLGYPTLRAIRECGCLLDAERARRSHEEAATSLCDALGRVAAGKGEP